LKQYGSEILRLWVVLSDYQTDLKVSDDILKQTAEQYRKIRNTFRFLMANVNDLETILPYEDLGLMDQWIVSKASTVFDETHDLFGKYNYVQGMSTITNFIVNELSGIYLAVTKDSLYCDAKDSKTRRGSQSAMAIIIKPLLMLLAPVLTYTADEILEQLPTFLKGDAEDIFDMVYTPIDAPASLFEETYMSEARNQLSIIVDALKKEKTIKDTLELVIYTSSEKVQALDKTDAEDWFQVSKVISHDEANELGTFEVEGDVFKILKADKSKCPRCWKFRSSAEDCLCERCTEVMV